MVVELNMSTELRPQPKLNAFASPTMVCVLVTPRGYGLFEAFARSEENNGKLVVSVLSLLATNTPCQISPKKHHAVNSLQYQLLDACDEVFVINAGGYVSLQMHAEIEYAKEAGKPVKYLETPPPIEGIES